MNNWLETEPDIPEPVGFQRSDHCCPMCGGVKRPLEDVCKRCYHSDAYKEKMANLQNPRPPVVRARVSLPEELQPPRIPGLVRKRMDPEILK